MPDFWQASGFHLLERDESGWLRVTDAFLRAYLVRPELLPTEEACAAERALHDALLDDPAMSVPAERIDALADPDAGDNYRTMLAFRDRLLAAGTVEACYLNLFRAPHVDVPPLFVDQMVHVILRNALDGCDDPLLARAGELFFRTQKVTVSDGAILLADEEVVEFHRAGAGMGSLGQLIAHAAGELARIDLDILGPANAPQYWGRSNRYDTVLDATFGRPGLDALCRLMAVWLRHFLAVEVAVQPLMHIRDRHWTWHTGLDAESTAILNDLYQGAEIGEDRLRRLLALFRLEFLEAAAVRSDVAGHPVYLGLAMDWASRLRVKPQNLLVNLPLASPT